MSSDREIRISKEILDDLPPQFKETRLGDLRGAKKQFRSSNGTVHVREYYDEFAIRVDREDPRKHPFRHLIFDSPETVGAFCTTLLARSYNASNKRAERGTKARGLFEFVATFIFLNSVFRELKHLLNGFGL
jgi:hypothetical protein